MHVRAGREVWMICGGCEELFFEWFMDVYNFSIKLLWLIIFIVIVMFLIADGKYNDRSAVV